MKKYIEQRIELIIISLVLIVSIVAFMLLNSSTAWFAKNDKVNASGLSISAKTTPNLFIATSTADITNGTLRFDLNLNSSSRDKMVAVTRDSALPSPHLKYVTNHYAVSGETGNALPGMSLEFSAVPQTDNEAYFIDNTVYLASVVDSISVSALAATITVPDKSYLTEPYVNAASIDFYFYVCDRTKDECKNCTADECKSKSWQWCGTTSVADSVNGTGKKVINILTNASVPQNTNGYVAVLMRFYFDGALVDSNSGKAYVNSTEVKSDKVTLGVQFTATEN